MRVTALLYSGRRNPSWTLSEVQAGEIAQAIGAMTPVAAPAAPTPALGYSGVRVDTAGGGGDGQEWLFAQGLACGPGGLFRDDGRAIERALLATGAEREVDPMLRSLI